jgi:catechol 2,3-dioxygenase
MPDTSSRPLHPKVGIGHVHLKVADLERALHFYRDVLGFQVTQRHGQEAAFLSAGGYHHHIGLNTWESQGGSPPPPGTTGLYHLAILYPTRTELADALGRVLRAGIPLEGASDHGVSEAIYLRDPDGNGVELYWDRPQEQWPIHTMESSPWAPNRWIWSNCWEKRPDLWKTNDETCHSLQNPLGTFRPSWRWQS